MGEGKKERWELLAERLIHDATVLVEEREIRRAARRALGEDEGDRLLARIEHTLLALRDELQLSGDEDQSTAKTLTAVLARYVDKIATHAVQVAVGAGVLALLQGAQSTADEVRECVTVTVEVAPLDEPAVVHEASASGASKTSGSATAEPAGPVRTSSQIRVPLIRAGDDVAQADDGVTGEIHQTLPTVASSAVAYATGNVVDGEAEDPAAERYDMDADEDVLLDENGRGLLDEMGAPLTAPRRRVRPASD